MRAFLRHGCTRDHRSERRKKKKSRASDARAGELVPLRRWILCNRGSSLSLFLSLRIYKSKELFLARPFITPRPLFVAVVRFVWFGAFSAAVFGIMYNEWMGFIGMRKNLVNRLIELIFNC